MTQPDSPIDRATLPVSPMPAHLRASLPMRPDPLSVDVSMVLIKRMVNELQERRVINPAIQIATTEDQNGMTIRVEVAT